MNKTVFLLAVLFAGSLLLSPLAFAEPAPANKDDNPKSTSIEKKIEYPQVKLRTEMGDIVLELYSNKAPISVDNFIKNSNNYHYDGLIFHRVIRGFMTQSGGHTFDMTFRESGRDPIANESSNGLSNIRGSIAMARMPDPDSAQAQFFINHGNNPRLDGSAAKPGYAVFGMVVSGMDVVDAIASVEVRNLGIYGNVPVTPIRILSARLLNPDAWKPLSNEKPDPKQEPVYEIPTPLNR